MSDTENTDGKEALDYFANLTSDPSDHIMSLQDMEKVIKFHEEELAAEDIQLERLLVGFKGFRVYGFRLHKIGKE